jgi:hypothetical protein
MHFNPTRHNPIVRFAAFALLAVCITQLPVSAYPAAINTGAARDTHIDLYKNIWINPGLARGQTLRYTWANLNDPDPLNRKIEPSRIRVKLLAPDRSVIAQTEAAAVDIGQFQSFDFNRDEINLPGEDPTGRLQTILEATVIGQTKYNDIVLKRGILETFDDAVEILDNAGGRTTVGSGGGANGVILNDSPGTEHLNPRGFQITSAGKDHSIGFVPGQTLRVSGLNPLEPPASGEDGERFKAQFAVTLSLSDGRVIAQGDEITLEPGQSHFFDFKRIDLPLAGESGGRLQVHARVIWNKRLLKGEFPSLVEIVDASTGKTRAMLPQKPKEIVVVGSK